MKVRFEKDGKGSRDLEYRVKIQSESTVREFGVLIYPYAASFESLDIKYVRVRKPDGSVVETPPTEVQELDSAVSREAPMYTDDREKHIAVKSLSVGDTLEVALHWTVREAMAAGQFWFEHSFHKGGTCKKEILELNVPKDRPVRMRYAGISPATREDADRKIYTFESSYIKPPSDSNISDWEKNFHGAQPPDIGLSSFTSWEEVGTWFAKLVEPRIAPTPEIRAKALDLVKDKTTEDEKIRAIYSFVATRFRYIGIDLGVGRYTPHAASDVLANRYGDCKDKHVLFAALLRAAGISSSPALISSSFKIDPDFPTPSLFDHVITAIQTSEQIAFADATPELAPYGLLLPNLRDRNALVATSDTAAKLVKTPADPILKNYEIFQIDSSIDAKGTLDAKMRLEERGDQEVGLRLAYRNTAQNRWEELTQQIMRRLGFAGTVSEVSVGTPEDTEKPFIVTMSYHRTDFPDWKTRRVVFPSPPMFLPELNEEEKVSKDPLPLGALQDITYTSTMKFPPGFVPITPEKVERKTEFAEFTATYSVEKDALKGSLHLKTLKREIPGSQRVVFSSMAKLVGETVNKYVFVQGNFQDSLLAAIVGARPLTEMIPQLEEAQKQDPDNDMLLMRLSRAYQDSGRSADAVALLQRTIEAHPDDVPTHVYLELGRAYLHIHEVDKAVETYKKALTDDAEPYDLNEAAYALAEAKAHLPEALKYSTNAVESLSRATEDVEPENAGAKEYAQMTLLAANWDTLGWIKFQMGDAAGAKGYLVAAWDVWQSATIGEHLVQVYERLGEQRKAAAICNMANDTVLPSDESGVKEKLTKELERLHSYVKKAPGFGGKGSAYEQGSIALSDLRMRDVNFQTKLKGQSASAQFTISLQNGRPVVATVKFLSGAEELRAAEKTLAKIVYPNSFPDDTPAQILRKGTLTCTVYSKMCTLILMPSQEAPGSFARSMQYTVPAN